MVACEQKIEIQAPRAAEAWLMHRAGVPMAGRAAGRGGNCFYRGVEGRDLNARRIYRAYINSALLQGGNTCGVDALPTSS